MDVQADKAIFPECKNQSCEVILPSSFHWLLKRLIDGVVVSGRTHRPTHTVASAYTYIRISLHVRTHRATCTYA